MAADRTEFLIDIATKMSGGDSAAATLSTLGDRMLATGASAAQLDHAVQQAIGALEDSSSAMAAINGDLATAEQAYRAAEMSANRAAKSVEALAEKMADKRAQMQHAMEVGDDKQFWRLAGAVNNLEAQQAKAAARSAEAAAAMKNEGAALDALRAKATAAADQHKAISGSLDNIKAAAAKATKAEAEMAGSGKVNEMAEAFGRLGGPLGMAGQRTFALLDGVKKLGGAMGGALGPTVAVVAVFAALTAGFLAGTFAITKWAIGLADANRAGKGLVTLNDVSKKFHDSLQKTFGGLKIDGLVSGLQTLAALFDSDTAAGRGLKVMFEGMFQPIIDGVVAAIPTVERLFLYAEILALKAYIALKPYGEEIKIIGITFAVVAAIVGGLVVGAFVLLGAIIFGPIILLGLLVAAIYAVGSAVINGLGSAISSIGDLGSNIISGLVNGITGGAQAVIGAITGVVGGAIDAAKHMLGIASPSKVFAGIGDFTAQGFAEGVEGGAADAQGAIESMVAPPDVPALGSAGASGGGLGPITINVNIDGAGGDADGLAAKVADAVRSTLERLASQLGGGEVAHA